MNTMIEIRQREKWWERFAIGALSYLTRHPKLVVLLFGLSVATVSLGTWVGALYLETRVLKAQLAQQEQQLQAERSGNAAVLKGRLGEVQQQVDVLQDQMEQQQTGQALSEKEALALENARLIGELSELSKPQLNLPLVTVEPASLARARQAEQTGQPSKEEAFTKVDIPHDAPAFTLLLPKATETAHQSYFVELAERKSGLVAWGEPVKKGDEPHIKLTLARRGQASGRYRIKLYGLNGKKKEVLDHYDVLFNYLPAPKATRTKK